VAGEFEKLAYEAALRRLDKQERLLEGLRTSTAALLAASSLVVLFLGGPVLEGPRRLMFPAAATSAFAVSIGAAVFVLMPRKGLVFAESAEYVYRNLLQFRDDTAEIYRQLTWELERFWRGNDAAIARLARAYQIAAVALLFQVGFLSALVLLGKDW